MTDNVCFALTAGGLALLFLAFWAVFVVRKEKACRLIAGFNSLPENRQAQYDRAAIARDYRRLFAAWTVGAFLCAALCLLWGWIPFAAGMALLLLSVVPQMHLWAENAFQKYKLESSRKDEP